MTVTGRTPGGKSSREQEEAVVKGDQSFGIAVAFARTPEGQRVAGALREALSKGAPVELAGTRLAHDSGQDIHPRAPGGEGEPEVIQLTPVVEARSWSVRIEVESAEGRAAYPRVDLRYASSRGDRLVMTNEHQALPWLVTLEITDDGAALKLSPRRVEHGVYEARAAAAFALAIQSRGAVVRVVRLDSGSLLLELTTPASASDEEIARLRSRYAFTDELCFIQERIARHGRLSINHEPSPDEVATASRLFRMLREGRAERLVDLAFTVQPSERAVESESESGPIHVRVEGGHERLFGVEIPLGLVRQTILDRERFLDAAPGAAAEASSTGKAVRVELRDLRVLEEHLEWISDAPVWGGLYETVLRLSASVAGSEGYFNRAEARAVGMSDTVFEEALREGKIETVATEVYHFSHFARADREELMTLWIQTDRQGVLSHDTALFLHQISDILPRRSHVIVPPGWDPGERKFDGRVVLYHAEVGDDEISWIGPVPYTAPLRTLRDCITTHIPPDLIEQAIAEGVQRGMFTEADLPRPDERKGAA